MDFPVLDYNNELYSSNRARLILMLNPAPELQIHEFLEELGNMSRTGKSEDFSLRRIERAVRTFIDKKIGNIADAYMVLGIISYLRGDRQPALDATRNAVLLSPSVPVLSNAVLVYGSMGEVREAHSLLQRLVAATPDNKDIISKNIRRAFGLLQFGLALSLLVQYDKLAINDKEDGVGMRSTLEYIRPAYEAFGMTEAQFLDRLETAVGAVRACGYEVRRTSGLTLHDGSVYLSLHVEADSDVCAELNFAIADALVDKYEDTGVGLVSLVTSPLDQFNDSQVAVAS